MGTKKGYSSPGTTWRCGKEITKNRGTSIFLLKLAYKYLKIQNVRFVVVGFCFVFTLMIQVCITHESEEGNDAGTQFPRA